MRTSLHDSYNRLARDIKDSSLAEEIKVDLITKMQVMSFTDAILKVGAEFRKLNKENYDAYARIR